MMRNLARFLQESCKILQDNRPNLTGVRPSSGLIKPDRLEPIFGIKKFPIEFFYLSSIQFQICAVFELDSAAIAPPTTVAIIIQ